jgi:hypothetical protein
MNAIADEQSPIDGRRQDDRLWRRRLAHVLPVGLGAALAIAALPAVAGAADYCVAPNTDCGGTKVQTFQGALDQAAASIEADRVFLGAAIYTAPTASGFHYFHATSPVEIVGAGQGGPTASIVTSPAGASGDVLRLLGGPGTSLHDLRVHLPQNLTPGLTGLETNGTARRVTVADAAAQTSPRNGVRLVGGVLDDSLVGLGLTNSAGVRLEAGTVRDSGISADLAIVSYGGLVERTGADARSFGVIAHMDQTTIRSSEIRVQGASATGVLADVQPGDTTVVVDGVNIIGPGGPAAVAAHAHTAQAPASSAVITLTNSLLRGFATALRADAAGSGAVHIAASYSDYDASKNIENGANAHIGETNISHVGDAGFFDVGDGDYSLLPGSPLVDAGDPATTQGLDIRDNPLVTDGNLDGTARRDIGAFERPGPLPGAGSDQPGTGGDTPPPGGGDPAPVPDRQAPLVSGFVSTKKVFSVGRARTAISARAARGTRFRYTLSEPARVTLKLQRVLPGHRSRTKCVPPGPHPGKAKRCVRYDNVGTLTRTGAAGTNSIRFTGRLGRRGLRPGRYRALMAATDVAGNRSAARVARFRVARG